MMKKSSLVLVLSLLLSVAPATAPATAGVDLSAHRWIDSSGRWVHFHGTTFRVCADASIPSYMTSQINEAIKDWNDLTILTVTASCSSPNIVLRAVYDDTGTQAAGSTSASYHYTTATITFNTWYLGDTVTNLALSRFKQVACHEIGHALGLAHGGNGCMTTNRSSGDGSDIWVPLDQNRPGPAETSLINQAYGAAH